MRQAPPLATPQEAKAVWEGQQRPSARTVATALTQAGRPVHFTTINRWRRQGWRTGSIGRGRAAPDGALPASTGDPRVDREHRVRTESQRHRTAWPLCLALPEAAKKVWDDQQRPSARSTARALTQVGRQVHFTTVSRWRRQGWQAGVRDHPLDRARTALDSAVPVLTGDPTTTFRDFVGPGSNLKNEKELPDYELLRRQIRELLIAMIMLNRAIVRRLNFLAEHKILETAILIHALSKCSEVAVAAYVQILHMPPARSLLQDWKSPDWFDTASSFFRSRE
jgi:hypothetical protein